jgi:hypothetical protein
VEYVSCLCAVTLILLVTVVLLSVAALILWRRQPQAAPFGWKGRCARCGAYMTLVDKRCDSCGLALNSHADHELRQLASARELLREMATEDRLESSLFESVDRALQDRRARLLAGDFAGRPRPAKPAEEQVLDVVPIHEPARMPPSRPKTAAEVPHAAIPSEITHAPQPTVPPAPRAPRRSLADMLSGFMEEKNILWGEVIGGLLIVGCSVALVISLWGTLERIPYFPFLIIAASTAAIFGAGLYTLHRWRLESTSRGLLVIATLLVPLNFLVMAGLPRIEQGLSLPDTLIQVGSLALFVWLLRPTSKVLVPPAGWWLPLAIAGSSAAQLLVPRLLERSFVDVWKVEMLAALPVGCSLVSAAGLLLRLNSVGGAAPQQQARQTLTYLGTSTFALAVALGFLIYWAGGTATAWQAMAPVLSLAALPGLAIGVFVTRHVEGTTDRQGLDVAGTAIMLAGALVMLLAVAAAWPEPSLLAGVCALNTLVLIYVAIRFDQPVLQAAGLACFILGDVVGFNYFAGTLNAPFSNAILEAFKSGATGRALLPVVIALSVVGDVLARWRRGTHSWHYGITAVVLATWSLALVIADARNIENVTEEAIRDKRMWAAILEGVYALLAIAALIRSQRSGFMYLASVLLLAAIWHALFAYYADELALQWRMLLPLLIVASLAAVTVMMVVPRRFELEHRTPLARLHETTASKCTWIASVATVLALFPMYLALSWHGMVACAGCFTWLALIWAALGIARRWPALLTAVQLGLTAALLCGVTAWMQEHALVHNFIDLGRPRSLHIYGIALALFCLCWLILRLLPARHLHELVDPHHQMWPAPDRVLLALLVVGQLALALWGLYPGLTHEFAGADGSTAAWTVERLQAVDQGAWWLLWILFVVVLASLWEKERATGLIRLIVLACTLPVLISAVARDENACASTWRWSAAAMYLIASAFLWLRGPIVRLAGRIGIGEHVSFPPLAAQRLVLFLGTFLPVLVLTLIVAQNGFAHIAPAGPDADSVFAQLGWVASNVVPLVILSTALVGHAVRERSPGYAFSAGMLTLVTVVGGYALGRVLAQGQLTDENEIQLLQLATLVAGLWAYLWLLSRRWLDAWRERPDSPLAGPLMGLQVGVGFIGNLILLLTALCWLLAELPLHHPLRPLASAPRIPLWTLTAGSWLGWLALAATILPAFHISRRRAPGSMIHGTGVFGLLLGILIACSVSHVDHTGGWRSFHVLTLSWSVLGMLVLAASWIGSSVAQIGPMLWGPERRAEAAQTLKLWFAPMPSRVWVQLIAAAVVLLALRGSWGDPSRPYWSAGATLAASVLLGLLALWSRNGLLVYASGLLVNLVGIIAWQAWLMDQVGLVTWMAFGPGLFQPFLYINFLCLAISGMVWWAIERLRERSLELQIETLWRPGWLPSFSRVAPFCALHGSLILVLMGLSSDLGDRDLFFGGRLAWATFACIVAAVVTGFWDRNYRLTLAEVFIAGLTGLGLLLHSLHLPPTDLLWWIGVTIGGYLLLAALIDYLPRSPSLIDAWQRQARGWILPAQLLLGALALGLSFWIVTTFPTFLGRLAGPLIVALLLPAIVLQWRRDVMPAFVRGAGLNAAILVLLTILVGQLGWSAIAPDAAAVGLQRLAVVFLVFVVMAEFCGTVVPRMQTVRDQIVVTHTAAAGFAAFAACVALILLAWEISTFHAATRHTDLLTLLVWLCLAGLLALVGLFVRFAVVPGFDPLNLSEKGRTAYVYAGEFLVMLLLLHLRVNVPELFSGFLARFWTFVVIGVAFLGVGLAEWLHRRGLHVLAWPLFNTGLLLAFVPVVVYWLVPVTVVSEMAEHNAAAQPMLRMIEHGQHPLLRHSTHWLMIAMLFTMIAAVRRQFLFAFLAALFLNFALWSFWGHLGADFALWLHPQIWFVPLALILLATEYVQRDHLSTAQALALRNAALLLLYVSSTADMFIEGLGNSIWPPIVLALLAVVGVLLGILLRVRAFLIQGTAFLFVVVLAQIWHAAVDRQQTWVWWASGIVLGAAILTLFAIFEKRKQDVVRLLEELREWH